MKTDTLTDGKSEPKRSLVLVGAVAVLGLVVLGLWLSFRAPSEQIQGMADADNINVSAKVTARISKLLVHEGDRVKAGQPVFELDSPEVRAKEQQAHGALDAATAKADKADAGSRHEEIQTAEALWRSSVASAELASSTYRRLDKLYEEGVVTRQKRDEARAKASESAGIANANRALYDMTLAGTREQDKAAADAQVREAKGALAEVNAARVEVVGFAPQAGEISKRMFDVGELVPAGYPVFTLVDVDHMWVALNVREDHMQHVKIDGRLKGTIPALGGREQEFRVYFINPAGDYATWRTTRESAGFDVRTFEVRVRPVAPVKDFRPGMSVLFPWPQE